MACLPGERFVGPGGTAFTLGQCPPGYGSARADLPAGITPGAKCLQQGQFRDALPADDAWPRCVGPNGATTMCPGAVTQALSGQFNASGRDAARQHRPPFMGAGVCVDPARVGTAVVAPGCDRPTGCVFRATDAQGQAPDSFPPTDFPGFGCRVPTDPRTSGWQCQTDRFVCDLDSGLCRHASQPVARPAGAATAYADCALACGPATRFACNAGTGACEPSPQGTLTLADCRGDPALAPACAAAVGRWACRPDTGCQPDPAGPYDGRDACQQICRVRCVNAACVQSDDPDAPAYGSMGDCGDSCGGQGPPPAQQDDQTGLIVGVSVACAVVGLVAVWLLWRRARRGRAG